MSLFRIAVCDDDSFDLEWIHDTAKKILQAENIDSDISCYKSGEQLISLISSGKEFDLILLDVMLYRESGIKVAQYLRKNECDMSIVFISNNREMAMFGYEVDAERYLAKPVDENRFREALMYCYKKKQKSEMFISVNNGIYKVFPKDIIYIEVQGRGCSIVFEDKKIKTVTKISEFEKILTGHGFVRCHQGFLVNMRFINLLRQSELELTNGDKIPVSKHRIRHVKDLFLSYLES